MKKLFVILTSLVLFAGCEKMQDINLFNKNDKSNPCPTVNADAVPSVVTTAFQTKYPGAIVEKWFNKDNKSFCALFQVNGVKTLAEFNNDGTFSSEESDNNQDVNNQDNNSDTGCDCELDNEKD